MKYHVLILALAVSPLTYSGEITVDSEIDVLAVNGLETKTSIFGNNKIEVNDGTQQIVVKYSRTFGNEDLVESKPYIFNIEVNGPTHIKTEKITSKSHASRKINKDLSWYVTNSQKEYVIKNADKLTGKGFMPYSDLEGLIADYNQDNNINQSAKMTTPINTKGKNMLIEQYKVATKAQKKQFKMWLIENETN